MEVSPPTEAKPPKELRMKLFFNSNPSHNFEDPFAVKESVSDDAKLRDPLKKHWMEETFLEKGGIGMQMNFNEPILGLALKRRHLLLFFAVAACFFAGLILKAADLQIFRHNYFERLAEGNRQRIEMVPPNRGVIYDRSGKLLVSNVPNFSLMVAPNRLPRDAEERYAALARLGDLTGIPPTEIEKKIAEYGRYSSWPIVIKDNLDYNSVALIETDLLSLAGAAVNIGTRRRYLFSDVKSLSHIIGYEGRVSPEDLKMFAEERYLPGDWIGRAGAEAYYERQLRGKPGRRNIEVDALGHEKKIIAAESPVDGANLTLAIDFELQKTVEDSLRDELSRLGKKAAAGVVLDAANGEILAMVSLPTYDNNFFAAGITEENFQKLREDKNYPLLNRAISGFYPPGSTVKPFLAGAALEEKIITPATSFLSKGGINVGEWKFPDWKAGGHGETNVTKAIAESVNTFFCIIGGGYNNFSGLGISKINAYLDKFGFGKKLGIDLPAEAGGFLPTPEWKEGASGVRWFIGDTYHVSIGQGSLLATPLQIAAATAAVGNGGTLFRPRILLGGDAENYILNKDFISTDNLEVIRNAMRETVRNGTARGLQDLPIAVAGKTGTAEWRAGSPPHAWFSGFGPFKNPRIAIVILIEAGGEGSQTAVPAAKKIFDWWARNRN